MFFAGSRTMLPLRNLERKPPLLWDFCSCHRSLMEYLLSLPLSSQDFLLWMCLHVSTPLFIRTQIIWVKTHTDLLWPDQFNYICTTLFLNKVKNAQVDLNFGRILHNWKYTQFASFYLGTNWITCIDM